MNHIKKYTLAIFFFSSFTMSAQSSNVSLLNNSLKAMQPLSVKDIDSDVYVSLNAASVTPEIYEEATQAVCMPIWLKKNDSYLKDIKSVFIRNKFSYSGYAFDEPRVACQKAGDEQPEQSKVTIMSHTRLFTNKGN